MEGLCVCLSSIVLGKLFEPVSVYCACVYLGGILVPYVCVYIMFVCVYVCTFLCVHVFGGLTGVRVYIGLNCTIVSGIYR